MAGAGAALSDRVRPFQRLNPHELFVPKLLVILRVLDSDPLHGAVKRFDDGVEDHAPTIGHGDVEHFNVRPDGSVNEFFHCH